MMKTLDIIQTLSKIGKVLSKIVLICCIVGICGCIVGVIAMMIGGEAVKIGGVTLHSLLQAEAGIGEGTVWAAIAVGMILSIGEFFIAGKAYRYFENEEHTGTPFTAEGAKELLHLGISVIWISIVSVVLAEVAQGIIAEFMGNTEKLSLDCIDSVALGATFIVVSLLCKCGAEAEQEKELTEVIDR